MDQLKRIVITGSGGLIGQALTTALSGIGEVWGIDQFTQREGQVVQANLLDPRQTCDAIERVSPFDILIHLAALAHGQKPVRPETMLTINTKITANILSAVGRRCPHFVFFSSVAVYGEDERRTPVDTDAKLRPSTEYGLSKQECEIMILNASLPHVDILRLAPVYDETHLNDIRKRVFVPNLPIKVKLLPPPCYSLCHINSVVGTVAALIQRGPRGRNFRNVADPKPYSQHAVADWFQGLPLFFPVALSKPLYWLAQGLPGRKGYELRCLYWKIFHSNVYTTSSASS